MEPFIGALITGIGATLLVDGWSAVRKALFGIAVPDYGLVGRWFGHMAHGQFQHTAIAKSPPVRGERVIGWVVHYLTGISFAAVLIVTCGPAWLQQPTIVPALIVGIVSVAAPFLLMQPGMGAGIAAARTPRPAAARLQSVITHTVFGLGLYVAGWLARAFVPS